MVNKLYTVKFNSTLHHPMCISLTILYNVHVTMHQIQTQTLMCTYVRDNLHLICLQQHCREYYRICRNFCQENKFSPSLPMHAAGENSFLQVFLHSEKFSTRSWAHACNMCIAQIGTNNSRAPPTTSWKITHVIGEIKFGENFVPIRIQSMSLWWKFYPAKILVYTVYGSTMHVATL